jgi:Fe-S-cluster containining protein
MPEMQFVPWQHIADWKCTACGYCCKLYSVVLNLPEWLQIIRTFGVEKTVAGLDRLYIKRADDGSCTFLCHFANAYFCGLQHMKPGACKLWPFKVLTEPRYGQANGALFNYDGRRLFIYADSMCPGLRYGTPTWEFNFSTLKEFVELALGKRQEQCKTTSKIALGQFCQSQWYGFP